MNVIFVSPNFPPNFQDFCTALQRAGATVLGLGDAPCHELSPELRLALTEYYHVASLEDYDAMLRACGYFTHRYGKIDRIESHTEFWLGIDAQLRKDFNIFGQKPEDLEVNRRKMGMKKRFIEAGIPCAAGIAAVDAEAVRRFVNEHGYPVIFKPDQGVGAMGAFKISDEVQLQPVLNHMPEGYVVETVLSGDLMSFDGLTNRHGEIVFWTSHQFCSGIMEIVTEGCRVHYFSLRDIPPRLEELGRRVVAAFDVRERFFHIEFFRKEESDYFAMEINVRPPGGFTVDLMNYSADIDLYNWWADLVVHDRGDFPFERKYHVAQSSRRIGFTYRLSHEALLAELGPLVIAHREIPYALSGAMGNYAYIMRSPDLGPLKEAIELIEELA